MVRHLQKMEMGLLFHQKDSEMIKIDEIPLLLLMSFILIYATCGVPNNVVWSGLYFFVNYLTMLFLFLNYNSKMIRLFGISLSISILLFIVLKYFFHLNIERTYTIIPFAICLITLIKLHKK